MKKEEILILEREDLFEEKQDKSIVLIDFTDFKISTKAIQVNGIILFIDENGKTKILQNRYGNKGNIKF